MSSCRWRGNRGYEEADVVLRLSTALWPILRVDKRRLVICQKKLNTHQGSRLNIPPRPVDLLHAVDIVWSCWGLADFASVCVWDDVEEDGGEGEGGSG